MRSRSTLAAALATLASLALAMGVAPTSVASPTTHSPRTASTHLVNACAPARPGRVTCLAQYVAAAGSAKPLAVQAGRAEQSGALTPAQIQDAYDVDVTKGSGRTIGIVDFFDNPKAEKDLAVFRARYGLPACTTANGCFRKVNQEGQAAPLPPGDKDSGVEIALDIQAASAVCPKCKLLLVEAKNPTFKAIAIAENTAVSLGATVVSNSYGANEFARMRKFAPAYVHPDVPILASTGDFGFTAASFPAVLKSTVAVGGTTIRPDTGTDRGWKETVWAGAGSGCSAYIAKPFWQPGSSCGYRTVGDVSAMADPRTGLLVYDTYGGFGWIQVGGTSLSSPLVGAMIAMSSNPSLYADASRFYRHPELVHDVVGGSNGFCGGDYLCTGLPGYDAPSGVGSPDASRL